MVGRAHLQNGLAGDRWTAIVSTRSWGSCYGGGTLSAFEFILILISIVAGFAVSEILAGWGRLIRERVSLRATGLYLAASFLLLAVIVRYVWVLWSLREMSWQFPGFVLTFSPMLVLALAAYVTSPARTSHFSQRTHYFDQSRPLYYLLALFFVLWTLGDINRLAYYEESGVYSGRPEIPWSFAARGVAVAILVFLAHTRRPSVHWLVLAVWVVGIAVASFWLRPGL